MPNTKPSTSGKKAKVVLSHSYKKDFEWKDACPQDKSAAFYKAC